MGNTMRGYRFLAIGLLTLVGGAVAELGVEDNAKYGKVIEVEPVYGMVAEPAYQERCWQALALDSASKPESRRQCEKIEYSTWREELVAYRVAYRYRGRIFRTKTAWHPGEHIRIDARLNPILF